MTALRFAKAEDATALVHLLNELGYPSDEKIIQDRLSKIKERNGQVILAVNEDQEVLGCVHVFIDLRLAKGETGEIVSLVVKTDARGQRIGKQLLDAAKNWLAENDCTKIRVRANSIRKQAHQFYERLGFDEIKTQKIFQNVR